MTKIITIFIILIFVSGCATNMAIYGRGQSHLKSGNYEKALEEFKKILESKPNDPLVLLSTGATYYFMGDHSDAVLYLKSSLNADPKLSDAYFYLGMAYEQQGKYREAIIEYGNCIALRPNRSVIKKLDQRRAYLNRELTRASARNALQMEREIASDLSRIPDNTVAVTYFTNVGALKELDVLGKGLAGMLITDISKAKSITVVERIKLAELLNEIKMEGVNKDTAARPGMLLGASRIITGSFNSISGKDIDIVSSLTMTKMNTSRASKGVSGSMQNLFDLEKDLAFGILGDMGVVLTDEERNAIRKTRTKSYEAFMAYSRGIDFSDKGMYKEAAQEFERAIMIDPGFDAPRLELNEANVLILETKSLESMENLSTKLQSQSEQYTRLSYAEYNASKGLMSDPGTPDTSVIGVRGSAGLIPTLQGVDVEVIFPQGE